MFTFPRVRVVVNMKWQKRIIQVLKSTTACVIRDPEPEHNPYYGLAWSSSYTSLAAGHKGAGLHMRSHVRALSPPLIRARVELALPHAFHP